MKKIIFVCSAAVAFASCSPTKAANDCVGTASQDCICTKEYLPVCGCDGKTYSNACEAKCAGVKTWTEGACGR